MGHAFRHLDRRDFLDRVRRVDPRFARFGTLAQGRDMTARRPVLAAVTGFAWLLLLRAIAEDRPQIAASLRAGSLPEAWHGVVMVGLTALLAVSGVLFLLHLLRVLRAKGARRANSGGLLAGALAALLLMQAPGELWQAGESRLTEAGRDTLTTASARFHNARFQLTRIVQTASVAAR